MTLYVHFGIYTTNTDRIKGLVWRILQHPDGFTGEIIVCDNTQGTGTGINQMDNNSEDMTQSIIDVINTFYSKSYPVYLLDWITIWDVVVSEYSDGDYTDGFWYNNVSKISYPKFLSPSGDNYISLRYGIWDDAGEEYDLDKLCIINFPVLKSHGWAGASIAIKNWMGVMTTAYADARYGGWTNMHEWYVYARPGLVSRIMRITYPDLNIVDATFTSLSDENSGAFSETRMLAASTDPVAISWYTAKYMLTPVSYYPILTDPDNHYVYSIHLRIWGDTLINSPGLSCTKDSTKMSIYDRYPDCADLTGQDGINILDVVYLLNFIYKDGPAPEYSNSADVNHDTNLNILDIVYLLNYIYKDGPAPDCLPVVL